MSATTGLWVTNGAMPRDALSSAAQLLTRAFAADPLFTYVQPSDRTRERGLQTIFAALLRDAGQTGGVLSTAEGVVAWTPVGRLHANLFGQIQRGYAKVPLHFGLRAAYRLQAHDDWCNSRALAQLPPDAAYIHGVGVEPTLAGRGVGSKLMNVALARIAQTCSHCGLRTEQQRNVRFYEKLGFRCVEQVRAPSSGLMVWFFVREF